MIKKWSFILAGAGAGLVNGLFGAGGGLILVPLLTKFTDIDDDQVFPTSVSIILPICIISLVFSLSRGHSDLSGVIPYLIGSAVGGIAAGFAGRKIPTIWLHRSFGLLIIWGGVRYLC
jgi:uncharacterized membrane protein YfcA